MAKLDLSFWRVTFWVDDEWEDIFFREVSCSICNNSHCVLSVDSRCIFSGLSNIIHFFSSFAFYEKCCWGFRFEKITFIVNWFVLSCKSSLKTSSSCLVNESTSETAFFVLEQTVFLFIICFCLEIIACFCC